MVSTATPPGQTLASALSRSEPLTSLLQRLHQSQGRLDAMAALLPAAMRPGVRAGPLDDQAWVLLADNAATAAKLRQLLPQCQACLQQAGWPELPIRIKVRPRG
jgi:hypothetical protein